MSFGEVDTLNLLFDKLSNILNDTQGYYESFLEANTMYKQGKLSDREFFEKLGDYVVAYSALEFLAVKVISELKKSLDKMARGQASSAMPRGSSMSGIDTGPQASHVTAATLPGAGRTTSIITTASAFSITEVLQTPDQSLIPKSTPSSLLS